MQLLERNWAVKLNDHPPLPVLFATAMIIILPLKKQKQQQTKKLAISLLEMTVDFTGQ